MGKIIATAMSMLMMAITCMAMILLMLPVIQKVKIEQSIRDFAYEANQANGFTSERKEQFIQTLTQQGIKDLQVILPAAGEVERYESKDLVVEGKLHVKKFGSWLYLYDEELPFKYKGKIYGKRILN